MQQRKRRNEEDSSSASASASGEPLTKKARSSSSSSKTQQSSAGGGKKQSGDSRTALLRRHSSATFPLNSSAVVLPSEIWGLVFTFLEPGCIGIVARVCRAWRDSLLQIGPVLWHNTCSRVNLLTPDVDATAAARKKLETKLRGIEKKHGQSTVSTQALLSDEMLALYIDDNLARRNALTLIFKDHYVSLRARICRFCLQVEKAKLDYPLYDINLCRPCRMFRPFAWITTTESRKFFRPFDHGDLRGLHNQEVKMGSTTGHMYRFSEVVAVAEKLNGKKIAAEQAQKAVVGKSIKDAQSKSYELFQL